MPARKTSASNTKRTVRASSKGAKAETTIQSNSSTAEASSTQPAASSLQSIVELPSNINHATDSQPAADDSVAARNIEEPVAPSTSDPHPKGQRVGPSRGPNQGVDTIRLAQAAGVKILDFAYEKRNLPPSHRTLVAFNPWRALAFFDSQLFAHRAWVEIGSPIGVMPLRDLFPVQMIYRLVECGWLDEEDFEWDDAKEVFQQGRKMLEERRKNGTEPMWYMRDDARPVVKPTFRDRYDNVIRNIPIIATIMALRHGETLPVENPEELEDGAILGPIPEEVEHFKGVVRMHALRASERRRVAELMKIINGEVDEEEDEDEEGGYASNDNDNGMTEERATFYLMDVMQDLFQSAHAEARRLNPMDEDPMGAQAEQGLPQAAEIPVLEAPSPLESASTAPPRKPEVPDRVMTRAQKRKLAAMDQPEVMPARDAARRPLPRAACPRPLVERETAVPEDRPTKRLRSSTKEKTKPNTSKPARTQPIRARRGAAKEKPTPQPVPQPKASRKPAARKTQTKGRRGRNVKEITSRSLSCK